MRKELAGVNRRALTEHEKLIAEEKAKEYELELINPLSR